MVNIIRSIFGDKKRSLSNFGFNLFTSSSDLRSQKQFHKKTNIREVREKARWVSKNIEYAINFLRICKNKVIGSTGFILTIKDEKGEINDELTLLVITLWKEFCKKNNCEVQNYFSFRHLEKMIIHNLAVDGEVFILKLKGFKNNFRYTLKILDSDSLDENLYCELNSGNSIKSGIEFNEWGRPEAYWFYKKSDSSLSLVSNSPDPNKYNRVNASEVIHLFIKNDLKQIRGESWFTSVIDRLNVLYDYCDLELASSKLEATKKTWLINKDKSFAKISTDEIDSSGNKYFNSEVGDHRILKGDWDVKDENLQHPNKSFSSFVVTVLRGISSGLGVSYNNLANDLERVNYSSLRSGALEEIEVWQDLQSYLKDNFHNEIFKDFLEMINLSGKLKLNESQIIKIMACVEWRSRGYPWVDPLKEVNANILAVNNALKTRTEVLAERGQDFKDTIDRLKFEQDYIQKNNIKIDGKFLNEVCDAEDNGNVSDKEN